MTKRAAGKFKVVPNQYYPTPGKAIDPLIMFLQEMGVKTFVEPCYGKGHIVDYLESQGFKCVRKGDIEEGEDARDWKQADFVGADVCITNTPWSNDLMQEIMWAQTQHVPGWFLINSDWIFTKQSAKIMWERCTDIVPIGRVKWFDNKVGFDNCTWVRMTAFKQPDQFIEFWPFPVKS